MADDYHQRRGAVRMMTIGDSFTRAGAHRLARDIQRYWGKRGYSVLCTVDQIGEQFIDAYTGKAMNRVYQVRSDMINGWPRGWVG